MKKWVSIFGMVLICLWTDGQIYKSIQTTAGHLKDSLSVVELQTVTDLKITGSLDARDFVVLRDSMPLLSHLDISEIRIEFYSGFEGTIFYQDSYPANEFPSCSFMDPRFIKVNTILKNVILPSTISSIGDFAFGNCFALDSVWIPPGLKVIPYACFFNCIQLSKIVLPNELQSLKSYAFFGCDHLSSIRMNSKPMFMDYVENVFSDSIYKTCKLYVPYYTKGLYEVYYTWKDFENIIEDSMGIFIPTQYIKFNSENNSEENVEVFANVPWTATSDQTWLNLLNDHGSGNDTMVVSVQDNLETVSRSATITIKTAGYNSSKVNISQQAGPYKVANSAGKLTTMFSETEKVNMRRLIITGTINAQDFKTMRDELTNLEEIDLSGARVNPYSGSGGTASYVSYYPGNEIPELAFYSLLTYNGKMSLKKVILPLGIYSVGNYAFQNCTQISSITIPKNLNSIKEGAFFGFYGRFDVDADNSYFAYSDSILFNKSMTQIYHCSPYKKGEYIIPSTVTKIGVGAFRTCQELKSIVIPSSVTSIEKWAFQYCYYLSSLTVNSVNPINLTNVESPFFGISMYSCVLRVPVGSKTTYQSSDKWKDFLNIVEIPTDLKSIESDEIMCYPNPVSDKLRITGKVGKLIVEIYDINGKIWRTRQLIHTDFVDVSGIPKGIYMLKILTEDQTYIRKFEKK